MHMYIELHPLRRILTKSSKRKKVRMRLLIGSHMGEGTSVSMPMQMMLVMITMETSVVNHSRPTIVLYNIMIYHSIA